jgi:methionyl aminopeptidase
MTVLTNEAEICKIREAGRILKEVFAKVESEIAVGVSTAFLDNLAEETILKMGGEPAFKGYKGYPTTTCASVNDVVVHGIPSGKKILAEGDILSLDIGLKKNGFFADSAKTFAVGKISDEAQRLIKATKESLYEGIKKAVSGNRLTDISNAIQRSIEKNGYEEVRTFVGHGIGRELHEPPEVPNWGEKGKGIKLKEGLLLAIEPMVNEGTRKVKVLDDGWTAVTCDAKLSAHFEHTIIVGKKKAEILT